MEDSKHLDDFERAMLNVRRAHRLIYDYQRRMLDLIEFIRNKLDFPPIYGGVGGTKHFSNPLYRSNNNDYFQVSKEDWAWDFLPSYEFEYYLGEKETKPRVNASSSSECYALSILQITDTGYFDGGTDTRLALDRFATAEEAKSKLLFIFELKPKGKDWVWDINDIALNKKYCKGEHKRTHITTIEGNKQIIYSFAISRFVSEDSTMIALEEFIEYVEKYTGIRLSLIR